MRNGIGVTRLPLVRSNIVGSFSSIRTVPAISLSHVVRVFIVRAARDQGSAAIDSLLVGKFN